MKYSKTIEPEKIPYLIAPVRNLEENDYVTRYPLLQSILIHVIIILIALFIAYEAEKPKKDIPILELEIVSVPIVDVPIEPEIHPELVTEEPKELKTAVSLAKKSFPHKPIVLSPVQKYNQQISKQIQKFILMPHKPVYIYLLLRRDGQLIDYHLEGSTGSLDTDQNLLDIIVKAAPFPKPPADYYPFETELAFLVPIT